MSMISASVAETFFMPEKVWGILVPANSIANPRLGGDACRKPSHWHPSLGSGNCGESDEPATNPELIPVMRRRRWSVALTQESVKILYATIKA